MYSRLKNRFYDLQTSFWFIPLTIMFFGLVLAEIMITLDRRVNFALDRFISASYIREADAARALLGTIASTSVTLVGLVFSITFVALVLSSQQYGPRMLENFTRDRHTRIAAGLFLATFLYCTIVAGAIRDNEPEFSIPQVGVLVGLILGVLCVFSLIYYIHHLANSIRSEYIVERVSMDLRRLIDHLYPEEIGVEPPADYRPPMLTHHQHVPARESGFFQNVIGNDLIHAAQRHNVILELEYSPGEFVLVGTPLVTVYGEPKHLEGLHREIHDAIDLSRERTMEQDVRFAFDKLIETAVRSLSAAINDPITTMMCLDRLAEGLIHLAQHGNGQRYRLDEHGDLRLIVERPVTFVEMVGVVFTPIRRHGKHDLDVILHMLRILRRIGSQARTAENQQALRTQVELIREQSEVSGSYLPAELALIHQNCDRTERWLTLDAPDEIDTTDEVNEVYTPRE